MASQHHDTGYKELFSHPEFVQQLVEGFAPPEIGRLMDFSTLRIHAGNYITPLFEEKFEDVVWSVRIDWQGLSARVYLYILLEFQSSVDRRMPIRLLHYVACFYDHLLKSGAATAAKGLPPVLPMVLYNGARRWAARQDIYEMIQPEPPEFLRVYQPHLRYYLIDEGRYTNEQRLGAGVELEQLNSVVEEKDMLAENWKYLGEKERLQGRLEGRLEGERRVLQRQLTRRFGELPAWVLQRLEAASAETLETWTDEILTASSLEELFGR